jgi:hypothetical protein
LRWLGPWMYWSWLQFYRPQGKKAMLSLIMVIGLHLNAFFLFFGLWLLGWMDGYICSFILIISVSIFACKITFFSLCFVLNNKRCYFIKTVLEGSLSSYKITLI